MDKTAKKMTAARAGLVLDEPFFGVLALRLRFEPDPTCKTLWVDGRSLGYNPEFAAEQSTTKLKASIAHAVMHCACGHPWRRDLRDAGQWNTACDKAVNPILRDAGFALPDGAIIDSTVEGKSAEWIYDRMPEPDEKEDGGGASGDDGGSDGGGAWEGVPTEPDMGHQCDEGAHSMGEPEPSPQGEVRDAPPEAAEENVTEVDWNIAVQHTARVAAAQGKLPAGAARFAEGAAKPTIDWRSALRRFVSEVTASDYTWTRPNPRYIARGLYMPKLHAEEMGPMVIAIDTSGSIDSVLLGQFADEVRAIIDEANPVRVHVMYCDAKLQRTDTFEREDLVGFDSLDPVGGGGTSFTPVFDAIEAMDEPPVCAVYLTDLMGLFPKEPPEVPTLWATTIKLPVPFGEVLPIA